MRSGDGHARGDPAHPGGTGLKRRRACGRGRRAAGLLRIAPALGLLPRTISIILVFLPVFFFMVKMYWASTTPPTSAHTLALATAPIFATAVLSMVARRGTARRRAPLRGSGPSPLREGEWGGGGVAPQPRPERVHNDRQTRQRQRRALPAPAARAPPPGLRRGLPARRHVRVACRLYHAGGNVGERKADGLVEEGGAAGDLKGKRFL